MLFCAKVSYFTVSQRSTSCGAHLILKQAPPPCACNLGLVHQVWDVNNLKVVVDFPLSVPVMAAAMSAVASAHCLVAVGSGSPLQLCDPGSGAVVHTLMGHKSDIWAVSWSLASEWHVLSGGRDGQARSPLAGVAAGRTGNVDQLEILTLR
jgi:WD40 repeat protein